ncbi:MAG: GntR family transcriptional regulator [Kiloniellales bacterium]|nr:GntR family transcriptional regulator [Kiloniellales bacterium]
MIKTKCAKSGLVSLHLSERPKTLRELALERMRSAIVTAHFEPGERLVERNLCLQLGVSRSVVREVVRHLESEGLVETVPHQGPVVARLDEATAAEIYEIRALLEGSAAAASAKSATTRDIAALGAALREIEKAYAREDVLAVLDSTTRFYETLFLCGGKSVSWEIVQRLNGRISRLRVMTISSSGRAKSGPKQMHAILKAIKEGNAEAARQACHAHIAMASAIAKEILKVEADRRSEA